MGSEGFDSLQLVGRQVPDVSVETNSDGTKYSVPLPGVYEVGVKVAGTFLVLSTFKAGNILNADGTPKNPPVDDTPSGAASPDDAAAPSGGGG